MRHNILRYETRDLRTNKNKMEKYINPPKEQWKELLSRPVMDDSELFPIIQKIIQNVRNNGDKSLKEYALKFDNVELEQLLVTDDEFNEALLNIDTDLRIAFSSALRESLQLETDEVDPRQLLNKSIKAVAGAVNNKIRLFNLR